MGTKIRAIVSVAAASVMAWSGTSANAQAQDQEQFKTQFILGVNFVPEWQMQMNGPRMGGVSEGEFSPNVGLSFEARITRHSGIETGFYYRNVTSDAKMDYAGEGQFLSHPASYQRYFSIPLLYKYYSRIVNVGIGATYEFMFDHNTMTYDSDGKELDKNRVGIMLKVSKDITLYKGLFLEPEFHFNPFWADGSCEESWIGFQIGLKYQF